MKKFVVEAVSEGHPDKVCDQIANAILDYCLERDPMAHVACEVFITQKKVILGGEITFHKEGLKITKMKKEVEELAREVIKEIGYDAKTWTDLDRLEVDFLIREQSAEIKWQVDQNHFLRLGDNSISFGYACNSEKDKEYFPVRQLVANRIMEKIRSLRRQDRTWNFAPDGKIIIVWNNLQCEKIYLSQQFTAQLPEDKFKARFFEEIVAPILIDHDLEYDGKMQEKSIITPFLFGGPNADTGLTGRKLMTDSYGPFAPHGGGSFIGKDPTKGDVSLALYARFIAKHLVAAGFCKEITIKIVAGIGQKDVAIYPVTQKLNVEKFDEIIKTVFAWNFQKIVKRLKLTTKVVKYRQFANYGFFGRNSDDPWEIIDEDIIKEIKEIFSKTKTQPFSIGNQSHSRDVAIQVKPTIKSLKKKSLRK